MTQMAQSAFTSPELTLKRLQDEEYLGDEQELPECLKKADGVTMQALGGLVSYLDTAMLSKELISLRNFSRCC